ncbi:MAG: hypothetical protein ACLFPX_08420 [Candidatus Omnitrophota bacterium]
MTQNVQELIDKIKSEGLEAGQQKADEIETQARQRADKIVREAQDKAEKIIQNAKDEQARHEQAARTALKQAARDMILSLRKRIDDMLTRVMDREVKETLDADRLASLLEIVLKNVFDNKKGDVVLEVSEKDARALKDGVLKKLQKELQGGIVMQEADDLTAGFRISFDEGRSSFDFSDEALTDFLGRYVNEEIADILKDAAQKAQKEETK